MLSKKKPRTSHERSKDLDADSACVFHQRWVTPQKRIRKKLRTRTATESRGMQDGRRLSWRQELVDTYWRHQLVPLIDSPGSALSLRLAHLSGTKLNRDPTHVDTPACQELLTQRSVEMGDTAWRHQLAPHIDSPVSASSLLLVHRSGTNLSRQQTDVGTSACLES
jgi:hypothetical protein